MIHTIHRVELRHVRFRLSANSPEIEVSDSPRTLRTFAQQLGECISAPVRFVEPSVMPNIWLAQLEQLGGKLIVTSLVAAGLTVSSSASASVALNGTEDVRRFLRRFTDGRTVAIERLTARVSTPSGGKIELLRGGRAIVAEGNEQIVGILRESLRLTLGADRS